MRLIALLLTTLTGFSGLVYEVLWQRYLATLLGSHGEATAAVLGIFLGGLAVGYAVFGEVAHRIVGRSDNRGAAPRVLFAYGVVEAGIGLYAFAFPVLFAAAQAASLAMPGGLEAGAFAFDVALTLLLIGPPTVLMGGTIPLLTQGLATGTSDATRFHALVYATNTLGAFLGAIAGGFVLIPWLGLTQAIYAMGAINLAAGVAFLVLGSMRRDTLAAQPAIARAAGHEVRLGVYAAVALLAGFAMMVLQTTFNRIGAMSLGTSHFTFATVVAAFVLCTALGSFAVSFARRIPRLAPVAVAWMLVGCLVLVYPAMEDMPYWAHVLRTFFRDHPAGFYPYHLSVLAISLCVMLVPLALSGSMLPLLFHHLRREAGDLGQVAGRLYSWNTLGSLIGALTGGYLLLFWLDLHHVYHLAVVALVACAALLSWVVTERGRSFAVGASALALATIWIQPAWNPDRLSSGLFKMRAPVPESYLGPDAFFDSYLHGPQPLTSIFYDDDPTTSVAVVESRSAANELDRSIVVNGKSDGSIIADDMTTRLLALIPAVLAQDSARAFIVGYGTGVTAGELAAQPGVDEIVVAEISNGVLRAAPHFEAYNGQVLQNPRIRIVRSDAYRALLRSEGRFDIIISEPSNPRVVGVEMLYSREFLEAARGRLSPRGIYAQWFHAYAMDTPTLALVLNTYRQVFPTASAWFTVREDVVLVGFAGDQRGDDLERIRKRWEDKRVRSRFERIGISSLPALLAHELLPAGVLELADLPRDVHTLLHPVLGHAAARAYFVGQSAPLPSTFASHVAATGARNSLLQRYRSLASSEDWAGARGAIVTQGCFRNATSCMTFLASWFREEPQSPAFRTLFDQARDFWGEEIREDLLPVLAALWGEPAGSAVSIDLASAEQAKALFAKHYSHALPFDARALHGMWKRCAQAGVPRCVKGLPEIETLAAVR